MGKFLVVLLLCVVVFVIGYAIYKGRTEDATVQESLAELWDTTSTFFQENVSVMWENVTKTVQDNATEIWETVTTTISNSADSLFGLTGVQDVIVEFWFSVDGGETYFQ